MKIRTLILIIVAISFGIIIMIHQKVNSIHKQKTKAIINNYHESEINLALLSYYDTNSEYPLNLEELKSFMKGYPHVSNLEKAVDMFSKKEKPFNYLPIYNPITKKREAFVLFSKGIDRKTDNLSQGDSIFTSNYILKLKFYDTDTSGVYSIKNLYSYFFGNKDYLISYYNYRDNYIDYCINSELLYGKNLIENILMYSKRLSPSNEFDVEQYAYYFLVDSLVIINDSTASFNNFKYNLICDFFSRHEIEFISDSIKVIGYVNSINIITKEIHFKNCLIY